jgi:hypothetical protein
MWCQSKAGTVITMAQADAATMSTGPGPANPKLVPRMQLLSEYTAIPHTHPAPCVPQACVQRPNMQNTSMPCPSQLPPELYSNRHACRIASDVSKLPALQALTCSCSICALLFLSSRPSAVSSSALSASAASRSSRTSANSPTSCASLPLLDTVLARASATCQGIVSRTQV